MPGATTRKPRVNRGLPGWRTALIVCHAISMAMTVVLPAPVASLSAKRERSGFASRLASSRCWSSSRPALLRRATSVNQTTVSAASTWQKNGRTPLNRCDRQWRKMRAVSGVTRQALGSGMARQRVTWSRTRLITSFRYCWSAVERPRPSSSTSIA